MIDERTECMFWKSVRVDFHLHVCCTIGAYSGQGLVGSMKIYIRGDVGSRRELVEPAGSRRFSWKGDGWRRGGSVERRVRCVRACTRLFSFLGSGAGR